MAQASSQFNWLLHLANGSLCECQAPNEFVWDKASLPTNNSFDTVIIEELSILFVIIIRNNFTFDIGINAFSFFILVLGRQRAAF